METAAASMKLLEETCEMCHLTAQARPKMMLRSARAAGVARLYRSTSARKFQAFAARDAGAAERCFRMFEDWARRKRELKALRLDIKAQERALKLLKSRAAPAGREIKELAAGIDRLLAEDGAEKKRAAEARD